MKAKYILYAILFATILCAYSCDDDDDWSEVKTNNHVNSWIYNKMSLWYYWYDKMPAQRSLNHNIYPEEYFKKVLYPYDANTREGDRFSWIQENYVELLNALKGVTPRDLGFEYYTGNNYYLIVYVKPNTSAASSGIKRGQHIVMVDNIRVSEGGNDPLAQGKNSYTLTVYDPEDDSTKDIKINVELNYAENPILLSKTILLSNNKKAGYVVYNQFTSDNGDNSFSYDKELLVIFNRFMNENVTDMVLDLRYNGGGSMLAATYLASALVPDRDVNNIFSKNRFNDKIDSELKNESDYDSYVNDRFVNEIGSSRLDKVIIPALGTHIKNKGGKLYILTGKYTASASELIINGLKPYMGSDIVLIGNTTYGKNVGSISLYEEKDSHNKWGMQPIVLQTFNANDESDYAAGFTPLPANQYNEFEDDTRLKPLGDADEILLATAIADITGQPKPAKKKSKSISNISGSSLEYKKGAFQMFVDQDKFESLINKE